MFFWGRDRFGHQVSTHKTRANGACQFVLGKLWHHAAPGWLSCLWVCVARENNVLGVRKSPVGGTWDHGTFGSIDGLRSLPPDVRLLARGAYSARNFWRTCFLGDLVVWILYIYVCSLSLSFQAGLPIFVIRKLVWMTKSYGSEAGR